MWTSLPGSSERYVPHLNSFCGTFLYCFEFSALVPALIMSKLQRGFNSEEMLSGWKGQKVNAVNACNDLQM